jgi:uncharacterized repeat protein (TIGR01451 family)
MNKTKIIVLSMLLMGLALFVNMDDVSADSSVIYVNATGGNDAWDGQSSSWNGISGPKKSIGGGTTAVTANGTVNIADGVYNGSNNRDITLNKNMVIKGQSKDNTIIDGSNGYQIFVINSGVNISLLNVTIRNAKPTSKNGGAIQNNGGTLTVNNCKFNDNSASRTSFYGNDPIYGGAIYSTGTLNIINSSFNNNVANNVVSFGSSNAQGGAIYSTGPLNIVDSIFTNNTALGSGGNILVVGGAISAQNTIKITGSTFINNAAGTGAVEGFGGGALYIGSNTHTVENVNIKESSFINNTAGYGGAIWLNAGSSTNPSTITKSTFSGNSASYGGAIRNWGFLNVIGSDFTGNRASQGAAINNHQGTANINFNRIIGNTGSVEIYRNLGTVNANNNWWGSNTSPSAKVSGSVNVSTWLVLNIISSPNSIYTGNTSTITADITRNQNGVYFNPANGHVPDGILVNFTGTLGSITSGTLFNGSVSRTFTAGYTPGVAVVNATVDTVRVNTSVNINPAASITITQSVNTPVNVGNKVTFLVNVKNNGPNTATNINIRDIIPNGLSGVIVTPSVGTYNATTGIWTIPSLINGSTATLSITGNATAAMAGKTTENTATQINQTEYTPELAHSTIGVYTNLLSEAYVSPNGDDNTGDGTESRPFKTIATAIATVNSGGTIRIKSGNYKEHDLIINKNLTIVGESASSTIIDAQKLGRLFNIASGSTVSISGLTLANGSVTGNGGAINNAGNLIITGTNLLDNIATGTGGTIYNTGILEMHFNKILGNGTVIASPSGSADATLNWWVSNTSPSAKVSGNVDVSKWLVLTISSSPNTLQTGQISLITADLQHDNTGVYHNPDNGHVPDGIIITFSSSLGTLSSDTAVIVNGIATTNFTATSHSGVAVVNATGSPTVSTDLDILGEDIYVSPEGNDETGDGTEGNPYATIAKAVQMTLSDGNLHILPGIFTGNGNFNVNINKNINITGSGADSTIIDAASQGRIFNIVSGSTVSISNLTLANGNFDGNGGAISNVGNLTLTSCNLLNNVATGTGGTIYNTGNAVVNFNRIIGEGIVIASPSGSVNAINNWWGSNADPISKVSGDVDVSTWLVLNIDANPIVIAVGSNSTITANLIHNNLGEDTSSQGYIPDRLEIIFDLSNYNLGFIKTISPLTVNGLAICNFTGVDGGKANVTAGLDDEIVFVTITIGSADVSIYKYIYSSRYTQYDDACVIYNIAVYNSPTSLNDATNVIVTDLIPDGLQFVAANPRGTDSGTYDESTGVWSINRIARDGYVYLDLVLKVVGTGTFANSGFVTADQFDSNMTNNDAINTPYSSPLNCPAVADIAVTQDVSTNTPSPGDEVTFTVTVRNNGPINISNVQVTSKIDPNIFESISSSIPGSYNTSTGVWTVGTLNDGESVTLIITATVKNTVAIGTMVTNEAKRTGTAQYPDHLSGNNLQIQVLEIGALEPSIGSADVSIYKYIYSSRYTQYDDACVIYNIAVYNSPTSLNDATNVIVTDLIPDGLQFVAANPRGTDSGTYDESTGVWSINRIARDGYVYLDLVLKVVGTGTFANSGFVTADQFDSNMTNNDAINTPYSSPLNCPAVADIAVTQDVSTNTPSPGDEVTFTVTVRNNGPINISNVQVTSKIDPNIFESISSSIPGSYNTSTGVWTVGTLNDGESVTLIITATVKNTVAIGTMVTNEAKRTGTAQYPDHLSGNNSWLLILMVVEREIGPQ